MTTQLQRRQRDDEICKLFQEGMSQADISRRYGLTRERIRIILGRRGLFKFHLTRELLVKHIEQGDSPQQIAAHYGYDHHENICAYLRKFNIPYTLDRRYKYKREFVDSMYADYLAGMTQDAVAAKYGICQSGVSRVFLDYHLPTRKKGGKVYYKRRTYQEVERIFQEYLYGTPLQTLATKHQTSRLALRRLFKKYGFINSEGQS